MRIQHNVMAMNAYRNYNNNVSALSSNLEKLSSGYRINRAGDDAAGLAISEKMRAQITGLDAAQKNVKDGISLVKTTEGALQEVQDMMNRMVYLATQSANGTYEDEVDRENLQAEVDQLLEEIDRIADSANFNGQKLLDGSLAVRAASTTTETISAMDRIITTTLKDGQKAHEMAGKATILDEKGGSGTAGSFKVDLKALTVAFDNGTATTASGTISLNVKIGDATISLTATGIADGSNGVSSLALASTVAGSASSTKTFININGVDYYATASQGVLTLTMKEKPTTASQCNMNFDVSVAASGSTTAIKNSTNVGVTVVTEAEQVGAGNAANTVFEIKESDILDGATIKLGAKTVTLKVGKDTTVTSTTDVVDLTSMEEGEIDLNKALTAISKAIGTSVTLTAKNYKGSDVSATFTVGVNDGSNGGVVGITIQRKTVPTTATGVAFDSVEKLAEAAKFAVTLPPVKADAQQGLTLQIGDTADSYNQLTVAVNDMHAKSLGIGGLDISNIDAANDAIDKIKDAINLVSAQRGDLGAIQNRLEHTANNLSVMEENITDAESSIRDTDVADEMMAYTKNNILIQSAQAMLAQANAVPQGVLQLLQ